MCGGAAMSGRPEGDGGDYGWTARYKSAAAKDFTPWRPSEAAGREHHHTGDAAQNTEDEGRSWWTEPQPPVFGIGDRVRSTKPVGSVLGSAVPTGTVGEVVAMRVGLFEEFVTVRFDNGLTEELRPEAIRYEGWF